VFVHSDVATQAAKSEAQVRAKSAKCTDLASDNETPEHWPEVASTPEVFADNPVGSSSSMGLVSAGLRQQMVATYVAQYRTGSSANIITDARAWMTILPLISSPTKALETAAYAVSLARLGTSLNAPDLQRESLKLYTQGLRRIQLALWDPRLMYSDETLAACMLLAIYEVFECPGRSRAAYISHFDGCAKLIQLRGPAAHADGLAHSIFQAFRFMGVGIMLFPSLTYCQLTVSRRLRAWRRNPPSSQPKSGRRSLSPNVQRYHFKG
jgi:hypothetical protein